MANEYLVSKWRQWFKMIDINHRGEISRADVKDEGKIFSSLSQFDSQKSKEMQEELDTLWNNIIFRGKLGALNEDEFIEMNNQHYAANKAKFEEEIRATYIAFFSDIVDQKHDGTVNEDGFVHTMQSCGHDNVASLKKFFQGFQPVDGKVSIKNIAEAFVQFTTCPDSTKKDVIYEAINAGFM